MLNTPGFQEERSLRIARAAGALVVIRLDGDDCIAEIVLGVLHHAPVKEKLEFKDIVGIAEMADKYELARPLRLQVIQWIQPYLKNKTHVGYEDFLAISWVFGLPVEFKAVSKELVWRSRRDGSEGEIHFKAADGTASKLSDVVPDIVIRELTFLVLY